MLGREEPKGGVGDGAVAEGRLPLLRVRVGYREFVARPVVVLVVGVGGWA